MIRSWKQHFKRNLTKKSTLIIKLQVLIMKKSDSRKYKPSKQKNSHTLSLFKKGF
jgi:hypothetical protein